MSSPRRRISIVWSYFEKLSRKRVRCRLCKHEQNYQGTTGNIIRHLKSKHSIDTTLISHNDGARCKLAMIELVPDNQEEEIIENNFTVYTEEDNTAPKNLVREMRLARSKVTSYCEDIMDPYSDNGIPLSEYIESGTQRKNKTERSNTISGKDNKHNTSIEEERILAEIEYFREKAEYYRMQKNLTALQAKKVKYELDRLG